CTPLMRRRYLGRLSGPLLDRVDMRITLDPLSSAQLFDEEDTGEASAVVAERVMKARAAAAARWAAHGWRTNAEVPGAVLRSPQWRLPATALAGLRRDLDAGLLSARGYDRVLRLAWTVSDLDGRQRPTAEDAYEARNLRLGDACPAA